MKRCDARILKLLLPWLLTASLHWPVSAQEAGQSIAPPATSTLPSRQAIKDCMNRARGAECLDQLFRQTLKDHSTVEALGLIARLEAEDPELRRDCHPVVHAIGRETYRIKGNIHDSFLACD